MADSRGLIGGFEERSPDSGRWIEPVALLHDLIDTKIFPKIPA
jgi:hypothetical protein